MPHFDGEGQIAGDSQNALNLGTNTIGPGAGQSADVDATGYQTLWIYAEIGNAVPRLGKETTWPQL